MDPRIKTVLYLGVLTALLLFVGEILGGLTGLLLALVLSIILNFLAYFYSDRIILMSYSVYPCTDREILEIVDRLARKAGIPTPKVYIMRSPYPNAFATGRNPKNSVIVITEGLIRSLSKEEIEAVIGHEISHIKNYDVLISTVSAVIAGTLGFLARMLLWGFGRRDERSAWDLLVIFLIPIMALLIRLAISREREYLADEESCRITGNPRAMISALEKISGYKYEINPGHAHMFIHNPLPSIFELFSTHPPVEKRIERIKRIFGV